MVKRTLFLLMILSWLITLAPVAAAQTSAKVYLTPVASNDDSITVELMADNVIDLYGVEFVLNFNPTAVSVLDANPQQDGTQVEAGNLLPENQGFVVINQADTELGKIAFAMTLLNPAPAVTGSGSLARMTFNLKHTNPSQVEIEDIKLVSFALQTIPVETTGLTIGSASTANGAFPWWIVALTVIVLGLVVLGALILARNNTVQKARSRA